MPYVQDVILNLPNPYLRSSIIPLDIPQSFINPSRSQEN